MSVGMTLIGGYKYYSETMPERKEVMDKLNFLPVMGAMLAAGSQALGILPVLQLLMAEIFPTEIRSTAVGLLQASFGMLHSFSVKSFPLLLGYLDFHGD